MVKAWGIDEKTPTNNSAQKAKSKPKIPRKSTHLFLNDKFLSTLSNISASSSLTVLYLHNNSIGKIENLEAAVNLRSLYLQHNKIGKIENLHSLSNLTKLYLAHNEISVVEGLESLSSLEELHVEKQRLGNDSLCFDPRTILSIAKTLLVLNASHNNIITVANLAPLKNIRKLNLSHNALADIHDVCEAAKNWYYLREASFIENPVTKQLKYRENVIGSTFSLSLLDKKEVSEATRSFIKRFEHKRLRRSSKPSVNLSDRIPSLPKNYPTPVQRAITQSILKNTKPCFDDSTLNCDVNDIYLPWKTMPRSIHIPKKRQSAGFKPRQKSGGAKSSLTFLNIS